MRAGDESRRANEGKGEGKRGEGGNEFLFNCMRLRFIVFVGLFVVGVFKIEKFISRLRIICETNENVRTYAAS